MLLSSASPALGTEGQGYEKGSLGILKPRRGGAAGRFVVDTVSLVPVAPPNPRVPRTWQSLSIHPLASDQICSQPPLITMAAFSSTIRYRSVRSFDSLSIL